MVSPVQSETPYDELEREVTAIISGWDGGFHTRPNAEHAPKKVIPITSQEILDQLRELKKLCNKTTIDRLFKLITVHARDFNNPHQTDLSQFATDILHLLYKEYTNRGGVAPYETFLSILFEDYQIAGLDDIYDGINPKLLTTVKLTAKYIKEHDDSETAHAALFKKMFPGTPVTVEPSAAIMTLYEICSGYQTNRGDKYTYIGKDGYRHLAKTTYIPIDYMFGKPTIALFGDRTNACKYSRDFSKEDTWSTTNLNFGYNPNLPSLNKEPDMRGSTLFRETMDVLSTEHILSYKHGIVESNKISNISFDFKPIKAKYLCIRILHKTFGISKLAILNFENNTASVTELNNIMSVRMTKCAENYFHVEYSIIHSLPGEIEIQHVPYHQSIGAMKYVGMGEDLCLVDNYQCEYGDIIGCSPFIYTNGSPVTRHGIRISVPVSGWFNPEAGAFAFEYINPCNLNTTNIERTLYAFRTEEDPGMVGNYGMGNIFFTKLYDEENVEIFEYPLLATNKKNMQMSFSYDTTDLIMGITGHTAKKVTMVHTRKEGIQYLDIGHLNGTKFFDGYFCSFVYYREPITEDNVTFLVGE